MFCFFLRNWHFRSCVLTHRVWAYEKHTPRCMLRQTMYKGNDVVRLLFLGPQKFLILYFGRMWLWSKKFISFDSVEKLSYKKDSKRSILLRTGSYHPYRPWEARKCLWLFRKNRRIYTEKMTLIFGENIG